MIQENRVLVLYSTRGASMFPFIRWNEYILVKRVPLDSISLGDTVVFDSKGKNKICHRVIRIEEVNGKFWFYTKGDKNKSYDVPASQEKILGKVIAIRRKENFIRLSLKYKFDCLFIETISCAKKILAKIPFLKKIYRYIVKKIDIF